MNACPTIEVLREWMQGELSVDILESVTSHVEDCASCVSCLDELSSDPDLASWMENGLGSLSDSARRAAIANNRLSRDETAAWPVDLKTLGPFDIEAEIGRGGMGVVYRAHDRAIERVVALKILRPEVANATARQRFVREIQAAARVEHDNIVRVYSTSNPEDSLLYFTMEYLAGPSLAERIRRERLLAPRNAAEFVAQVADGLAAAHLAGLVHRDVKPDNILIDPTSGRAKISDFGLARLAVETSGLTRDGTIVGTPAYLSPEQARGAAEVGVLADVYALGVTLYECIVGETPFRGSPHLVVQQIINDEPRSPRSFNDAIPRDLETICLKAMAKESHLRYVSCAEFAADLRRWLNGEPIKARSIGLLGKAWRICRRYPRVTSLAGAFILAMVIGTTGVFWQWRRAERNAVQARDYFSRSLASIDDYFVKVSENRLLNVPNLQPLRKELLAAASDYYEKLLGDRPNDLKLRVELAKARSRLAMVVSTIGSADDSVAQLNTAQSEFDQILLESPDDLVARNARRTNMVNLASVLLINTRLDSAHTLYERILTECESEHNARPEAVEPLEAIYAAQHGLGTIGTVRGIARDKVVPHYEQALETNRVLLSIKPDQPTFLRNTSRTAGRLIDLYHGLNREADALRVYNEGYFANKRLVIEHPESLDYRFAMAFYERQPGLEAYLASGQLRGAVAAAKLATARQAFGKAAEINRGLVKENPQVGVYRADLISILHYLAQTEYATGRLRESMAFLDEARTHFDEGSGVQNMNTLAKTEMANVMFLTGHIHSQEARADEALKSIDDGIKILDSVRSHERQQVDPFIYSRLLLKIGRAVMLSEAGRAADAVPAWNAAVEAAPPVIRPATTYFAEMNKARATNAPNPSAKQAAAAVSTADRICTSPLAACGNFGYAKLYATAASGETDATIRESLDARAVFRLEKASEAGYFRTHLYLDRLDSDSTLDRLRGRADYQRFRSHAQTPLSDEHPL